MSEEMKIGQHVQVIGDCNDELLGKRGTIVGIVVMDENYIRGADRGPDTDAEGWRWATPEDFRLAKAPYRATFDNGGIIPDALPVEIYYRVLFFVPVTVGPDFLTEDGTNVVRGDVFEAEALRIVAK